MTNTKSETVDSTDSEDRPRVAGAFDRSPPFESITHDDDRAVAEQSKSQQVKTTIEFFREKFADEETDLDWIDPKGGNTDGEREAKP